MKAAQTGHLVLSTLHTNDSLSAIIRLLDLDIPPYLIAASLSGIMAQRLVRKLCMCHTEAAPSAEYRRRIAEMGIAEPMKTEYLPGACEICDRTGFKGRVGIYELLALDEAARAAIRDGCNLQTVREAAMARGLRLMQEDALEKVRAGITTLDEVLRVVPFETIGPPEECPACGRNLALTFRFCPFCGVARGTSGTAPGAEKTAGPAEPVVAGKGRR
jgi:type II secretory ATPase GspE/PulE/Tfp pilus assembly ATPase PilB-like protein